MKTNNLEIALRDPSIRHLHLQALLNGFSNQLELDGITYEKVFKNAAVKITIDIDPLGKDAGFYVAKIFVTEKGQPDCWYHYHVHPKKFNLVYFLKDMLGLQLDHV